MKRILPAILAVLLLTAACSTIPVRERNEVGDLFDQLAETEEQAKARIYRTVKLLTEAERKLMTAAEHSECDSLETAMQNALQDGTLDDLEQRIAEWSAFAEQLRDVFSAYQNIDQTPFSDAELSMLSKDELNEYYSYQRRIDEALAARKETDLNLLKSQFCTFQSTVKTNIEAAKQKMLDDWVKDADFGSALGGILSLGSVRTTTTVSGHKITLSTQYMTDFGVTDEQIKSTMDSYLSWASTYLQNGVNALGYFISDISIRVEYKNVNGRIISEKEFKVTKATKPNGFNPPDPYYPGR